VRVAVVGGGSWGTTLAAHLVKTGHEVRLLVRDLARRDEMASRRENPRYLPGVILPAALQIDFGFESARGAEMVVVAMPSESFRSVCRGLASALSPDAALVSATKGLEIDTLRRMSEVVAEEAPGRPVAVLSGPSFALEVALGQPTAVVAAAAEGAVAEAVQQAFASPTFRVYSSDDVVGVELAGALKNVIAIAAGIVDGLGYGQNTVAALITRGLAEIGRLGVALGGRPETFSGLAGLGDLVLTATGSLSRNRKLGRALGSGRSLHEAVRDTVMVAEGVPTTRAACALARRVRVEMPIAEEMRAVLYEGRPPREAVDALMIRRLKRE
jgi:glycerol-3-phosphate dehydrogenase (NAD(P)+)